MKSSRDKRIARKTRIRSKISGTHERPRISVFRSSKYIFAQAIDDVKRVTIASVSTKGIKEKKTESSKQAGKKLAEIVIKAKVKEVVFDRNGYMYHGRVKAFAEGLREGGLKV